MLMVELMLILELTATRTAFNSVKLSN